jgi:hypothetical protein
VAYPPDLLDELARVFARVALDKLLEESAAEEARQEKATSGPPSEQSAASSNVVDGEAPG